MKGHLGLFWVNSVIFDSGMLWAYFHEY